MKTYPEVDKLNALAAAIGYVFFHINDCVKAGNIEATLIKGELEADGTTNRINELLEPLIASGRLVNINDLGYTPADVARMLVAELEREMAKENRL